VPCLNQGDLNLSPNLSLNLPASRAVESQSLRCARRARMLEPRITRITRMKETGRCDVFIRVIRVIRGLLRRFLQPLLGCGREPALSERLGERLGFQVLVQRENIILHVPELRRLVAAYGRGDLILHPSSFPHASYSTRRQSFTIRLCPRSFREKKPGFLRKPGLLAPKLLRGHLRCSPVYRVLRKDTR